jgi:1-acyl-sn-glycerol-3-phosphate acyltransferase
MLYYAFLRGVIRILLLIMGSRTVSGSEHIPRHGPYIIAVNHMSTADTPLLYISFPRIRLRFFAGERWERHWLVGPMLRYAGAIYIKRGTVDRRALRAALRAIDDGEIFALAPEGERSLDGRLMRGRDGAAFLATRTGVPILPVGLVNSDILMDNARRLRRTRMHVAIGPTFLLPDLGARARSSDLAPATHLIMVHIAALLPPRHRGYYAESPALAALLAGEDPWPHCVAFEVAPTA